MRCNRISNSSYSILNLSQWVAGFVSAFVAASTKAKVSEVKEWSTFAATCLQVTQEWAWVLIPLLAAYLGLAQLLRQMIGSPWIWDMIHDLLDDLQEKAFTESNQAPLHHNRATLFKHRRFRCVFCKWPWSGWLVPMERSGHATRRSSVAFRAPDDADQAEGIAGQTWAHDRVLFLNNLPKIEPTSNDKQLSRYAEKTWVTVNWMKKEQCKARSFCGIPVKVRGKPWGVIILDSREPAAISEEAVSYYMLIAGQLGKLLERA